MLPKILTINNPKSISHICLLVQIMEANVVLQKKHKENYSKSVFQTLSNIKHGAFYKSR